MCECFIVTAAVTEIMLENKKQGDNSKVILNNWFYRDFTFVSYL